VTGFSCRCEENWRRESQDRGQWRAIVKKSQSPLWTVVPVIVTAAAVVVVLVVVVVVVVEQ
jgi:hypothetical protein